MDKIRRLHGFYVFRHYMITKISLILKPIEEEEEEEEGSKRASLW